MVRTQLYIITQIGTYNYMFGPCMLAIVRLDYKLNNMRGLLWGERDLVPPE